MKDADSVMETVVYGPGIGRVRVEVRRSTNVRKYRNILCESSFTNATVSGVTGGSVPPRDTLQGGGVTSEGKNFFCGWICKEQWTNEVGQVKRCGVTPSRGWHPSYRNEMTVTSQRWANYTTICNWITNYKLQWCRVIKLQITNYNWHNGEITKLQISNCKLLQITNYKFRFNSLQAVLFCKRIFSGTHILIFDWRPHYSTCTSLRQ